MDDIKNAIEEGKRAASKAAEELSIAVDQGLKNAETAFNASIRSANELADQSLMEAEKFIAEKSTRMLESISVARKSIANSRANSHVGDLFGKGEKSE